jgi:hypothetical protein
MTNEEFIVKATKKHGNKYDYSQVNYTGPDGKVVVICSKHGPFSQRAAGHLFGYGCKKCQRRRTKTTQQFIEEAVALNGDLYDYSKVDYKRGNILVTIICPVHKEFLQTPNAHIAGYKCSRCFFDSERCTTEEFLEKAKEKFGDRYDYSKVVVHLQDEVTIICKVHGPFTQIPRVHLNSKYGCRDCGIDATSVSFEEFLKKANEKFGNRYDYSHAKFKRMRTKITIICPIHKEFFQTPSRHLNSNGCDRCGRVTNTEDFIIKANEIHNNLYSYTKTIYVAALKEVIVTCSKHGDFSQRASYHLSGNGCQKCQTSKGEITIDNYLKDFHPKVVVKSQGTIPGCKFKKHLTFDFVLFKDDKIIGTIEFNGIQHYQPVKHFGGMKGLTMRTIRDKVKQDFCENNEIPLLIIKYDQNNIDELVGSFLNTII